MSTVTVTATRTICYHANGWFQPIRFLFWREPQVFVCTDCEDVIPAAEARKRQAAAPPPPIPRGSVWALSQEDRSPWPSMKRQPQVVVIDTGQGWVRYTMGGDGPYSDLRMREESFRYCYRELPSREQSEKGTE